jgi:pSer/pThr/pTyr-binding forkhead associated (FHA) protein
VKNVDRRQALRGPHYPHHLPEVTLEITRGAAQRRRRVVRPPVFLIGAAEDCDLVLGDPLFPSVHTYLYVTSAGVSARHIGEGPALLVNEREVETVRLQDGDRLKFGAYEFLLHVQKVPAGDDRRGRGVGSVLSNAEGEFDPDWEQLQLLLCDLPAPIRPTAMPARHPLAPAAATFHVYERRAIA